MRGGLGHEKLVGFVRGFEDAEKKKGKKRTSDVRDVQRRPGG